MKTILPLSSIAILISVLLPVAGCGKRLSAAKPPSPSPSPTPVIMSYGSYLSPDGSKRLEVIARDKDIVDFEVLDAASGKKLANDSIGWDAMRWFLHWETSSRLWGYGSDVSYFKLFEFSPDGTVTATEADETMPVPSAVRDSLPPSMQKEYRTQEAAAPRP